jgi:class I fructose-bisphosphate aldolase
MVLFSGGSRVSDKDLLQKARICIVSGATGLIFGRNMWQRPFDEGLEITHSMQEILKADVASLRSVLFGEET